MLDYGIFYEFIQIDKDGIYVNQIYFFLLINLLRIQTNASNNKGEHKINILNMPIAPKELLKIKLVRKVPRNKLPMSPIKIFEGYQLKYRKLHNVPIMGNK